MAGGRGGGGRARRVAQETAAVAVARVADVHRRDALDDLVGVARRGGAVGEVEVLAEADVGELELVDQRAAVRERAHEGAAVFDLVEGARRQREEVRVAEGGEVGEPRGDRRHLLLDPVGRVHVVVVPVHDDVARRGARRHLAEGADAVLGGRGWADDADAEPVDGGALEVRVRLVAARRVIDDEHLEILDRLLRDLLKCELDECGAVARWDDNRDERDRKPHLGFED